MKLHQLTNGAWIDLRSITAIRTAERVQCCENGPIHPARLIVHIGAIVEVCPCDDQQQADELRDELAGLVNA